MNNDTIHTESPLQSELSPVKAPTPEPTNDYCPLAETSFSHVLNSLLKKPLSIIYEINHREHPKNIQRNLLIITLSGLAVFGLVLGMFSGGWQIGLVPLKIIGGVFFSAAICLPSLYIFSALGGMDIKVPQIIGLKLTFLAITSLLLVGFTPVLWLFSTSSQSSVFIGFLAITLWILCLIFGLRIITQSSPHMGGRKGRHLTVWSMIFIMVTLQMTTNLRPLLGESNSLHNAGAKKFFLTHWVEMMTQ